LSREESYINGAYENSVMFGMMRKDFEKTELNNIIIT